MAKNSKAPVSPKVYVIFTALVSESQYDHENTVRLELEFPNGYMGVVPLAQMASGTMQQAIAEYTQRLGAQAPEPDDMPEPSAEIIAIAAEYGVTKAQL